MTSRPESGGLRPGDQSASGSETEFRFPSGPPADNPCPIGWQPGALTPVFYGYRDYSSHPVAALEVDRGPGGEIVLPPANMRVFFPSLDGSPQDGAILQGCGLYPLILFVHGECTGDADHYLRWYYLPQELARAGYVVAVPELPGISAGIFPPNDTSTQDTLLDVLSWMRQDWEYFQTLMPAPATGLAGHSFGGMHAGILATKVAVAGVVSLSGTWDQWDFGSGPVPITELQVPQLFTWGAGLVDEAGIGAILADNIWDGIAPPKHRAVFAGSWHYDYLYEFPLPCRDGQGTCPYEGEAAADLTTMFFGRYLPPENLPYLRDAIPPTLVPPLQLSLTPEQVVYAGGYLNTLPGLNSDPQWGVITRVAGTGTAGNSGDDGPATDAELNAPSSVAVTADGGFLIADVRNYEVRKVSAAGVITRVAGTGTAGNSGDDGLATVAELVPRSVAVTADGGFLIADNSSNVVRKVSAAGLITRVAGTGTPGDTGDDGPATLAELNEPLGVAVTADGGFLIADGGNNVVRKVALNE